MIVDNENFEHAKTRDLIPCKCDFCGDNFERLKSVIKTSHRITKLDSCGKKECISKKNKRSCLERFGCENPSKNKEIQDKKKDTFRKRFGCDNPLQNKEVQEKRKEAFRERYGCDNPSQNKEVQEKRKETFREIYGCDNPLQNKEIQEKQKETNRERYGCDTPFQNKEVQEKIKETNRERFGYDNPFQNKKVQEKIKEINRERLGCDNPMQNEEVQKKRAETWAAKTPEEMAEIAKQRADAWAAKTPEEIEEISRKHVERWASKTPEEKEEHSRKIIETTIQNHGRFPAGNSGVEENSIRETLNSFGFDFKSNYTLLSGKQIDMYDENKKVGIEYCGLYWHNEFSREPRLRDYHHNKCKILESQGIQLLTIFEDEWLTRQKQCLGHIKATLGICDKKLHGRKCIVKEVDKDVAQQFFDDYHIQGKNSLTIITFGLFYDNELVGVMSMGRHHRQGSDVKQVVLDRLCFKDGVSVNGGSSKLLNACKIWAKANGYNKIISFSDNRWSAGKVYKAMGFTMEHESGPDYSYVNVKNPKERISKQSQQKKLTGCPADKTETQWAHENGLARIWDCGKRRWVMEINF